ncbi:3-deoxy-7-phosphoheptulonate synthase [Streptomyces sp. NPDC051784]|uniref:3-deoxy-7-phosphoheptulonate synthase n=1 Tax=Streptomyces sp. NPDC051784 TaxID=3155805 RepID=UPI00342040F3
MLLPAPAELRTALPLPPATAEAVASHRETVAAVLDGRDPRLLVIVGPCSVHDTEAALDYAELLSGAARRLGDDLVVVLRAYLEKPRTALGWKGLLDSPSLGTSSDPATGLRTGRSFLVEAAGRGMPLAYEFVDPVLAPYVADTVSWAAIGARTVASQPHRHLASWLPMPAGMKNCVSGDLAPAVAAAQVAAHHHVLPMLSPEGRLVLTETTGNPHPHLVLRGGAAPNHGADHVATAADLLAASGLAPTVLVDASHGNSGKDINRQEEVVADLAKRIGDGEPALTGVMIESYLADGRQELTADPLRRDVSVTDACLGWERTEPLLEALAKASRRRRRTTAVAAAVRDDGPPPFPGP